MFEDRIVNPSHKKIAQEILEQLATLPLVTLPWNKSLWNQESHLRDLGDKIRAMPLVDYLGSLLETKKARAHLEAVMKRPIVKSRFFQELQEKTPLPLDGEEIAHFISSFNWKQPAGQPEVQKALREQRYKDALALLVQHTLPLSA
jgi:hypothetical protein